MEPVYVGPVQHGLGTVRSGKPVVTRGLKLLLIALLALAMSLLALLVDSITAERSRDAEQARQTLSVQSHVGYISVAPMYQSVERSLKYAPLFLGSVFLAYFLFEIASGRRMHMAQYVLVGVAQLIFYCLLLSFAERIGFDLGFLLGGGATIALLSWNVGWVFRSARLRWQAMGVFSALYAVIYGLLRLQNNALLLGSLCSFAAITGAMYMTRELDWYGVGAARAEPDAAELR